MNDEQRAALVKELNSRARTMFDSATEDLLDGAEWTKSDRYDFYTMLADQLTDEAVEMFEKVLADRAATVAEPDAETVVVRDLGSVLRLEYARGYGDAKREQQFNVVSSTTYQPIAAMPSGRDDDVVTRTLDANTSTPPLHMAAVMSGGDPNWLDAALDSVPGMSLDKLYDGKKGPSSPPWYKEPLPEKRWTARVIVRQGQAGDAGYWITPYIGTGTTRKAAILDAVKKAKEQTK